MKTLFIECNMGAAGDMLMGALYELLTDAEKDSFLKTMNGLFPEQIMLHANASEKCGIWGTKMNVVIRKSIHIRTQTQSTHTMRQITAVMAPIFTPVIPKCCHRLMTCLFLPR